MKKILTIAAAGCMLVGLGACDALGIGGGAATETASNASANAAADNASANATAAENGAKDTAEGNASAEFDGEVTHAFLVGRWTDNNDCNNTITFAEDGSFTVPGGGEGLWVLDGDRLTFQGAAGSRSARIQAPTADTIMLIHDDGSVGRSTRCP